MSHDNGQTHHNIKGLPQDSKTETVILNMNNLVMSPKRGSTQRETGWVAASRKIALILTLSRAV